MKFAPALMLLMLVAAPALAQENQQAAADMMRKVWASSKQAKATIRQQVYDRIISIDLPRPFVAAYKQAVPGAFIMEYVPDGETLANWTQMITISSQQGLGEAKVEDADLARFMFNRGTCAGRLYQDVGPVPSGTSVRQRVVVIGCGQGAGGERAAIAFLRDEQHVWTVQFAQRIPADGKGKLFAPTEAAGKLAALAISACAPADAQPPCRQAQLLEAVRGVAGSPPPPKP